MAPLHTFGALLVTLLPLAFSAPAPYPDAASNPQPTFPLIDAYDATNWNSHFDVEAIADPTHGFVNFLSEPAAQSSGLYHTKNGQIYIGVDNKTVLPSNAAGGRNSVRLLGKKKYNRALVIADIAHMPGNACGMWPAFWMVGSDWPKMGEIDIIEGVNMEPDNQATLHTSPGCVPKASANHPNGKVVGAPDCGAESGFIGCGVKGGTYGSAFNALDGGVFAMLWTGTGISVWSFTRKNIPGDIAGRTSPNPSSWGPPIASWSGCDFDRHFRDLQIVFDTTFCGDWAGNAWGQSECKSKASTCEAFVAGNPGAFSDGYWLINSVKVYGV